MNVLHIKPVYHTYDAARMKWFGFLARFWLILSILFNLRNIVTAFEDGYVVLARLTIIGVFFLNIVAVVQLNRRRWTGVLALLGMSGLRLL
ncbi:MAG: hypothetical protein IJT94_14185, partial [Oscillibacter sp.]|nr:hypothetical protein [Oscillibacter sp.]